MKFNQKILLYKQGEGKGQKVSFAQSCRKKGLTLRRKARRSKKSPH
jgi:hypothetical protein